MTVESIRQKIAAAQACSHPLAKLRVYAVHFVDRPNPMPTLVQCRCLCGEDDLTIALGLMQPGDEAAVAIGV